jgi:hypothetical protein
MTEGGTKGPLGAALVPSNRVSIFEGSNNPSPPKQHKYNDKNPKHTNPNLEIETMSKTKNYSYSKPEINRNRRPCQEKSSNMLQT